MSVGLLLVLNFLSIPFIAEMEFLGNELQGMPNLFQILRLKYTLKMRWFRLYAIFMAIFVLIAIAPSESGKSHSAGVFIVIAVVFIQIAAWALVVYKVRKSIKEKDMK